MQPHKKFAFDVGITFLASVVAMPLGFIITILLGRYLGAGDLGLYRMTSTLYGIAMLFAAIGIPAAMIKYVAEFKDDRTKFNQIVSSGVITSLSLKWSSLILFLSTYSPLYLDLPCHLLKNAAATPFVNITKEYNPIPGSSQQNSA